LFASSSTYKIEISFLDMFKYLSRVNYKGLINFAKIGFSQIF
jgi:hypothetical protein